MFRSANAATAAVSFGGGAMTILLVVLGILAVVFLLFVLISRSAMKDMSDDY